MNKILCLAGFLYLIAVALVADNKYPESLVILTIAVILHLIAYYIQGKRSQGCLANRDEFYSALLKFTGHGDGR